MLRKALLVVALAMLAMGGGLWLGGVSGTLPLLLWGAVLLLAVLFERWRYVGADARRGGTWETTDERFIDPESGRPMKVLFNPRTGERRYEILDSSGAGGPGPGARG